MAEHRSCGHFGWLVQYKAPVWEPLVVAIGRRLAETFMSVSSVHAVDAALPSPALSAG